MARAVGLDARLRDGVVDGDYIERRAPPFPAGCGTGNLPRDTLSPFRAPARESSEPARSSGPLLVLSRPWERRPCLVPFMSYTDKRSALGPCALPFTPFPLPLAPCRQALRPIGSGVLAEAPSDDRGGLLRDLVVRLALRPGGMELAGLGVLRDGDADHGEAGEHRAGFWSNRHASMPPRTTPIGRRALAETEEYSRNRVSHPEQGLAVKLRSGFPAAPCS